MMKLNGVLALILLIPLAACGEAKFVGDSKNKGEPKVTDGQVNPETPTIPRPGENPNPGSSDPQTPGGQTPPSENPGKNPPGSENPGHPGPGKDPETPGPGPNPNVPEPPIDGEPTEDCVTQNGVLVPCPEDPSTHPGQN